MEASDTKPDAPAAASTTPPAASRQQARPAEDDAERYGIEGWRERVRRFGDRLSPHALAGALHDVGEGERLTEAEVRDRLEHFHRREAVERPQEGS